MVVSDGCIARMSERKIMLRQLILCMLMTRG